MPRTGRASVGDICYHVINRGNAQIEAFHEDANYRAFVELIELACQRVPMRVIAYCVMSNHFHLVLGRFKAFAIEQDEHLLTVLRYVERNPLRVGLVGQAENWRWSSLHHWRTNDPLHGIDPGPVPRPESWLGWVNEPLSAVELDQVRHSVNRGTPYGSAAWVGRIVTQLGLSASLRPRGRPRKEMEM